MYKPLNKLFTAIGEFGKELTQDIEDLFKNHPSFVIHYPDGIPNIAASAIEVRAVKLSDGWKISVYLENDLLEDGPLSLSILNHARNDLPF
mgnify:FL=1